MIRIDLTQRTDEDVKVICDFIDEQIIKAETKYNFELFGLDFSKIPDIDLDEIITILKTKANELRIKKSCVIEDKDIEWLKARFINNILVKLLYPEHYTPRSYFPVVIAGKETECPECKKLIRYQEGQFVPIKG